MRQLPQTWLVEYVTGWAEKVRLDVCGCVEQPFMFRPLSDLPFLPPPGVLHGWTLDELLAIPETISAVRIA